MKKNHLAASPAWKFTLSVLTAFFLISPRAMADTHCQYDHWLHLFKRHEEGLTRWMTRFYEESDHEIEFMQWLVDVNGPEGLKAIDSGGGWRGVFLFCGFDAATEDTVMLIWPAAGYGVYNNTPARVSLQTRRNRCPKFCDVAFCEGVSTIADLVPAVNVDVVDARKMLHAYIPIAESKFVWAYVAPETIQAMVEANCDMRLGLGARDSECERGGIIMAPVKADGTMDIGNAYYSKHDFCWGDHCPIPTR